MRTVKWNPFLSGVCMLLGGVLLVASTARADVSSSNPAAIVVFPKIVVDTVSAVKTDTVIQLTNTAPNPVDVWCFWIDANGHCSNAPTVICDPSADATTTQAKCGSASAFCQPGFLETDFHFRLTSKQPIVFTASAGLPELPLAVIPSSDSEFNSGIIQGVPEDPMIGELKCIEVGETDQPVDSNDLKGEATIEEIGIGAPPVVDIRGYNGIGIQAIAGAVNTDGTLNLGGAAAVAEYNGCPNILIMDHFFDDAIIDGGTSVRTHLTLVPCSENFTLQTCVTTTVQFLVFNEFEGRLSTSIPMDCFLEKPISDIGTRPGTADDLASIFNVAVQGTLTGQTWIRGVADADASKLPGHGLLGVAEEFHGLGTGPTFVPRFSAAYNLDQRGVRAQGDVISLPAGQAPD